MDAESYGYPLANPFEATIATTPPELRPELPADGDIRQSDYSVRLRPDREFELLDNFWPVTKLRYRLAQQNGRAPLIFIISGTGAHYASGTTEYLKKLFYGAGFHVVQLSSPTSYDFMAAASRSATPGYSPDDADDLYRAMQAVRAQHPKLEVSEFLLTGYSLGALHAAFVSQLDETRRAFDFKRVLLLNPPVNLYTSISNLDKLVQTKVQGIDNSTNFYDLVLGKLTRYFNDKGYLDINEAMLYDFQQSKEKLSNEQMAMLIGTSFRFSSADIVFTSDLLNRRGLITPRDYHITESTSLTPFFQMALRCDFDCYIAEQLMPMWRARYDGGNTTVDMPSAQATTTMAASLVPRCCSTKAQSASTPTVMNAVMASSASTASSPSRAPGRCQRTGATRAGLASATEAGFKVGMLQPSRFRWRSRMARNSALPTTPITVPTGIS